jgi:hypothetical protein
MSKTQILILLVSLAAIAIVILPFTWLCRYEWVPVSIGQEVITKHYYTVGEVMRHPVNRLLVLIISIVCGVSLAYIELKKK